MPPQVCYIHLFTSCSALNSAGVAARISGSALLPNNNKSRTWLLATFNFIASLCHAQRCHAKRVFVMLQIIFNLRGNALKFTTEGYIRVTVKPLPAAGVGMDMVQLSVEDTGCGIARDKQKLIFEAFGQV